MKKMENFLRRALSMLLSICMLFGNMGGAFAETASVVSESTGPLIDYVDFYGQAINTSVDLTYVGTSDYVWNGTGYTTLADYNAWYWVDVNVNKADDGLMESVQATLTSSAALSGNANVSLYYGAPNASVNMDTMSSFAVSAVTSGSTVTLKASGTGYQMPSGTYRFLVGLPIADDMVKSMLNNGSTITNSVGNVVVNGVSGQNPATKDHTVSFKPVVTKTGTKVVVNGNWMNNWQSQTYIRWELHYTNGIKLHETIVTDTISAGEYITTYNTKINNENAIQAYEGDYAIAGGETFSNGNKTITFKLTGTNEQSKYYDLRYKYTTDMTLVYYSTVPNGTDAGSVTSSHTLTPNGIAGTAISGKVKLSGYMKDVVVKLQCVENGGEPQLISNNNGNAAVWLLLTNEAGTEFSNKGTTRANSTGDTGIYTAEMDYSDAYPQLALSTQQSPTASSVVFDGGVFVLDANSDNKIDALDQFTVDIQDSGSSAVVTLTNYVETVPVSVVFKRLDSSSGFETDAEFDGHNAPNLFAVLMDAEGNAVSDVKQLTGTKSGNILSYNGLLSAPGGLDTHVALLTLKANQQFDNNNPAFSADKFNVYDGLTAETSTVSVNMDKTDAISAYETFDVDVSEDASGALIKLVNRIKSTNVTLTLRSYDETTKQYSAVSPANADNPNLYLVYLDAEGNAVSEVAKLTKTGEGAYTSTLVRADNTGASTFALAASRDGSDAAATGDTLTLLTLKSQQSYNATYNAASYDAYSATAGKSVYVECDGADGNSQTSASMDEFFAVEMTEADGTATVTLTNNRASALQGLVDAYNNGELEINEETGSFANYDGGKYFNELSPLGIAGSFHIVAFDTATLGAHTNGNILARKLVANNNFGTNDYPFELSYVEYYEKVHSGSASSTDHILALGAGNTLSLSADGDVVVNGTELERPKNVIIDSDPSKPFIDIDAVEADVRALSATLRSNSENVGISEDFTSSHTRLHLISSNGAGYYNIHASALQNFQNGEGLELHFTDQNKGSIVINVDCSGMTQVNLPKARVFINGEKQGIGEVTTFENGKVIWNFFNVGSGTTIKTNEQTGMIIAPDAHVEIPTNINGTIIAKTTHNTGESHRTDFTGTTTPASGAFSAVKLVNGDTPSSAEKFWFVLEEQQADGTWAEIQRKQNDGSTVDFGKITYNEVGTHLYRITESADDMPDGYTRSTEEYFVEVTVFANTALGNTALGKTYKFYKSGNQTVSGADKFIFNNAKDQVDLVLIKQDAEDETILLEGAEFTLTKPDGSTVSVATNNQGRASFSNLPDGAYTLTETKAPEGYELPNPNSWTFQKSGSSYSGSFENSPLSVNGKEITITNIKEEKLDISGSKTWHDNNNINKNRPDTITIRLYADGVEVDHRVVAANGASWSFTGLPVENADGVNIIYTIKEDAVTGYVTTYDGYNVINTEEETSVSGKKSWEGDKDVSNLTRPASITVRLWNGDTEVESQTVTSSNNWSYSFTNLPKYKNKVLVNYTVTEDAVPGYTATITDNNITNTLDTTSVSGEKSWDDLNNRYGLRPAYITVTLKKTVNGATSIVTTKDVTAEDSWKYTFDKLHTKEKAADGNFYDVVYSIEEITVPGYTTTKDGFNLKNTLETTAVNGSKVWSDSDNAYGTRPEQITVVLKQNTEVFDETIVKADENGEWKFSFTDLPKYDKDGNEYSYAVTENVVYGYQASYDQENYKITNTLQTKNLSGVKGWEDQNDAYGLRPDSVTIIIKCDGAQVATTTASADDWAWSVTGLPKYDKVTGNEIIYTVDEEPAPGYTAVISDLEIDNHLNTIDLNGIKSWKGDTGFEQISRPAKITVTATSADGSITKSVETTAAEDWKWTIEDLPETDALGNEIVYTITEAPVTGYTNTGIEQIEDGSYVIENTVETTQVSVTKFWDDKNNADNTRPTELLVQLTDGQKNVGEAVALVGDAWSYTWKNLPKYKADGSEIAYKVDEVSVPEGYVKTTTGDHNVGYTITNIYVFGASAVITADKTLEGRQLENEQFTFQLKQGDTVLQTKKNDANGNVTFDAIEYEAAGTYTYTVVEVNEGAAGYTYDESVYTVTVTVTQDDVSKQLSTSVAYAKNGADAAAASFVNTYTLKPAEIEISVTKAVSGTEGKQKVPAYQDQYTFTITGTENAPMPEDDSITNSGDTVKFGKITFTKAGEHTYTITESGYVNGIVNDTVAKTVYVKVEDDGKGNLVTNLTENAANVTFTNAYTTIDLNGEKIWVGDEAYTDIVRPDSVAITVKDSNGNTVANLNVVPDANGKWSWSVTELPKFDKDNQPILYTVTETPVNGYTSVVENTTITNTLVTVEKSGTKVWEKDSDNLYNTRPASITVYAMNGEEVVASTTATSVNNWAWSFTALPKFDKDGAEIAYTFAEAAVPGYTTEVEGNVITNTLETVNVDVNKTWVDDNNKEGFRPASITINLLKQVGDAEATILYTKVLEGLATDTTWTWSWNDLPKYENGVEIVYTITEEPVDNYQSNVDGYDIENNRIVEYIDIPVTKDWVDNENAEGFRPASVSVQLFKKVGDKQISVSEKVALKEDNNWSYTFEKLLKYENGQLIQYTVVEDAVPEYTTSITGDNSGFTITNSHTDEFVSLSGKKVWNDADNQDGIRPGSITLVLTKGDIATTTTTTATGEGNEWSWSFTNLPKFENGEEVVYGVKELEVEGYETEVSVDENGSIIITNTHQPEEVEINGTKSWNDDGNRDNLRPVSITVTLYKQAGEDGEVQTVETKTFTGEGDNWDWSFGKQPKFEDGVELIYTVTEAAVEGYTTAIDDLAITNTHKSFETEVKVTKVWEDESNQDGKRPGSITVQLMGNNSNVGEPVELNDANNWTKTWTNLPKNEQGIAINYTVQETGVPADYESELTQAADGSFTYTITNTYEPEVVDVPVTKDWQDADDQDGVRPESITFQLWQTIEGVTGTEPYATATTDASNWNHTFEDLPAYANGGKKITYTVTEEITAALTDNDYEVSVEGDMENGFTVTNSRQPDTTSVTATKKWEDSSNQDGKRPESITFHLMANDQKVEGQSKTLSGEGDVWTVTWDNLPLRANGVEITYTVEEEVNAEEYTVTNNGLEVVNSYTTKKVDVPVSKAWEDADNQDGIRPAEVTVRLYADTVEVEGSAVKLNASNNWKHTWTGLDMYKDGKVIAYTVSEDDVDGYTAGITGSATSGYVVTNTHVPAKTEVSGTKTWNDADDHDGFRPDSITVTLYAGGVTTGKTAVANESNNWTYSFTGLDKYADGKLIVYTVVEDAVEHYSTEYNGYDITNSYTPGKTSLTGTKVWNDANNQDGKRPTSITVTLMQKVGEGEAVSTGKSLTVTEADKWTWTFADLDKYTDGKEITYSVVETMDEEAIEAGYTTGYDGNNVVNTYEPETIDLYGSKTWVDADNQDGLQPKSITVTLYAGGESTGKSVTVTAEDDWKWSFTGLDKYKSGKEIEYTFVETAVPGYETTYSDDTFSITNTHEPKTLEIKGTKTWVDDNNRDGIRPGSITITLYKQVGDAEKTVKDTLIINGNSNDWSWTFGELPAFENGTQIVYTIEETGVPAGYTSKVTSATTDGDKPVVDYTITNTHEPETIKVSGTKVWDDNDNQDGKRTTSVTINLLADGEKIATTTANEASEWKWSFDNLPKYKTGAVKQLIVYTVTEEKVAEYTTTIEGSADAGFTVTNTHEPETTKVSGTKTWNDKNNQDGKRPASITINLLANGTEVAEKTVTEADKWSWSFDNLPVYVKGVEQKYTITEDPIEDYTTLVNGYNVTNSTDTASTFVAVYKVWDDKNNQDGLRPASISVQLSANGVAKGEPVTLNEGNNWSYTWTGLDKMAAGADIVYTVDEVTVPAGYEKTITGNQSVGYTITNTHAPETTGLEGTKTWVDNDNQDGKRPASVIIELLANGAKVAETEAKGTGNVWSWSFTDLDKFEKGVEIDYTVREVVPAGYTVSYSEDTTAITNTHEPLKTQVSGQKVWNDNDNQDGKRPSKLIVTLFADNVQVDTTEVTGEGNTWSWSFTGLDMYKGGKEIVYTVTEETVALYEGSQTVVNGEIIFTNTHAPEKITIEGVKEWSDAQNQDGIRPEVVTLNLLKGDEVIKTTTATKAGGWSWSFTDLDKYENGQEIVYTVEEVAVPGYTASQELKDGQLIITNTHEPEKTELTGTKSWIDDNDRDDIRPDSVTIKLFADGVDTGNVAYATASNGWKWSFTGLDMYKAEGVKITYTAEEVVPTGYTASYSADTTQITNTHEPETIDLSGSKTWQDNENQDGKRPSVITIRLLADGTEIKSVNVTADNNWSWSFEDLPKYQTGMVGHEIVYTITEDAVPEYTTLISGLNAINTHTPELIDLEGAKTWNDAENQDGKRPASIEITLLANGKAVRGPISVTAADSWKWVFTQLPKYEGGKEIVYTVSEAAVPEYGTVVTGLDVANSYTPGKTSISGVKVWDDANNQDGKRPASITINLMKKVGNGDVTATGKFVVLSETTGWNWSFTELDQYEGGKLVTYSVTEDAVPGYTTDIATGADGNVTITNSYKPETVDFSGSKTWNDADNQDGKQPASITVRLLADGTEVRNAKVGFQEGWSWSFTGLPKYCNGGVAIKYVLTEDAVPGYTTTINGMDVTNTYEPEEISVDVLKVWDDNNNQDGKRPASITVQLQADGSNLGDPVTLNEQNGWKTQWTGLPKYRNMGTAIVYTVVETGVPADYTASYSSVTAADGSVSFTITNTDETDLTSISGSKKWEDAENQDGIRPTSIVINLLAGGKKVQTKSVTPDQNGNWSWSFENLTKYEAGEEIVYTFTEEAVAGYETTYSEDTTTITNTHAPATVQVEGAKEWDDADNQDGKRPTSITINLKADGKVIDTVTVTEADGWDWSFTNLPKYRDQGVEIVYTVTEDAVEGYTTAVNGYNVKNSYTPGKVTVDGAKTWNDANDQDGLRPTSIEIQLYADNEYVTSKTVTEADGWKWSFTGLDEYKNGKLITYTIKEVVTEKMASDGYTAVVNGFDVTNTYQPETIDIAGSKTWTDADDQDGFRPEEITIRLWADAKNIKTVTIKPDENGNWPGWSWTDLPKYRDHGVEIVYTVTEDEVEEYKTEINGYDVTNTHVPETVEVAGAKTWTDADNQDGFRPTSITINLHKTVNGVKTENIDSVTVTEADGWAWSWTELPKRENGYVIAYSITENAVAEYTTEVNGYNVINTHAPEKVDVEGAKTWTDADNQDGKRPAYITINLLANGDVIDSKNITAENGWKWSWTGLDKYEKGEEIVYTITEDKVAEYTTEIDGYDVENTHVPETVEVAGTKTWNDANNQDGKRPLKITINLLADGKIIDTAVIEPDADGNWPGWKFENLPKYQVGAQGKLVTYTITEDTVAEYATEITDYDVLNSYTPGKTSVSVTKYWQDDDDRDGYRPESITFNLLADGTEIDEVVLTPDENGVWPTYTFEDLPIYEVGKVGHKVTYTVTEDEVAEYVTTFTGDAATGYYFTNTHDIETVDINGIKTWNDADNQDGFRPDSITINLLADGEVIETVTVTEADGWSWSWTQMPKYRDHGTEIVYTITEEEVAEYTTEIDGYDAVNTHVPKTVEVEGAKTWIDADNQDGFRPASININLLADGEVIDTATVTEADGWKWSWTELPMYKVGAQGKEVTYTVTEDAVAEYTTEIDGYDAVNTHAPETVEVAGAKTWTDADNQDGIRPEVIVINLLADGEIIDTVNVTAQEGWSWKWTDLPKYKVGEQGQLVAYTVTENAVEGYTTTITGYDVENTHVPETVEVAGSKTWTDAENQDGFRPTSITINLLADGEVIDTVTVTEAEGWSWKFTDLPKYKVGEQGKEVTYTITEDAVAEYTTVINGYDVENIHVPETVDVAGTKTWTDADNQDGKRPDSVTINLLANGEKIAYLTAAADDNWSWSWTELPKYENGVEIVYTITEEPVAEYTSVITGYDAENIYEPELITIEGAKTWNDADNQDGVRPASIVIKLMDGATVVKAVTVTEADGWKWTFTDLPKYRPGAQGELMVYTIVEELDEVTAAEYTATVNGYDVTNTHDVDTVEISGTKLWEDIDNKYGKRPDSITIRLYADGVEIAKKVVTAEENWSWSFTDLPMYKAGAVAEEISYTIGEDAVTGYTATVEGYNVRNTINLVEFIKVDEQTGKRLAGAKFALYEGGAATAGQNAPIEVWTSDLNAKVLAGLKVGQTYTIVETEAPNGYAIMAPFVFTVEETDIPGIYRSFTAGNCRVYRFRKLDSSNNGLVSGALLAVLDGDKIIESWRTDTDNNGWYEVVSSKLVPGVTYTLAELEVPWGYLYADPINFTIDANDGSVIVNGADTNGVELVMYDAPAPEVTPTPEPTETSFTVTKRWEDKDDVLGKRPASITVHLYRKLSTDADYGTMPFMTVNMADNGKDVWKFTFEGLPRRSAEGVLYQYMIREEEVEGYVATYLNNGRTIVNTIPEEDYPPTPTPTLPYSTPTPAPVQPRVPQGVRFVDGEWFYIDEYGIPLGGVPLTGDNTNFILWGMAIGLPLLVAALAAVEIRRRKKLLACGEADEEVEADEE